MMTVTELVQEYPQLKTMLWGAGLGTAGYYGAKYARRRGKKVNPALVATLAALSPLGFEYITGTGTGGNIYRKGLKAALLPTSVAEPMPNTKRYVKNYVKTQVGGMNPKAEPGTDIYTGKLPTAPLLFGNIHAYKGATPEYKSSLMGFADNLYETAKQKHLLDTEKRIENVQPK